MADAKSIEALSAVFTAGVAAGTGVSAGAPWALSGLLLPLVALPFFFQRRILLLPGKSAVPLVLFSVFLLGFFCALCADVTLEQETALELQASATAERLKALIGGIPFPSGASAPLLTALFTGDRSGLPRETVRVFRASGASHILALSGLHMGILYLMLDKMSSPLGRSPAARLIRAALMVLASGYFTLMTGAGPSIVRAFLFIVIGEVLRLTGRPRQPLRVLCLALLVQLALQPRVISSVGFQLSYLAMAGIFLLYPVLEKWYPPGSRWNPLRRIWQASALSISCQLFTAPLVWLRFGTFPRHFLLTNLMAIPLVTALMWSAIATLGLSALGCCPQLLIKATDGLGRLLVWVLEVISGL